MIAVENDVAADLRQQMMSMGAASREAARELARVDAERKTRALRAAAEAMRARTPEILKANGQDMEGGRRKRLSAALLDRLALDEQRVEATARGVESIADFDDPVGAVMGEWQRPNGLRIQRVRVPLASSASSTRAARTSPPTPVRCA